MRWAGPSGEFSNYGWLAIIKYTPGWAGDKVLKAAWFAFYAFSSQFVFYWRWIWRILNNLRGYQYLPNVFWISNEHRITTECSLGPFTRFGSVQFCPCKFIKNLLPHGEHKIQIRSTNTNFAAWNGNENFCACGCLIKFFCFGFLFYLFVFLYFGSSRCSTN